MNNQKTNFGKRKVNTKTKTLLVQKLFSDVSKKYDLMNDLMSLGSHRLWKKELIELMNIQPTDKIIDVGSGTGDLINLISKKRNYHSVYAIDLNIEMLKYAQKKIKKEKKEKIFFLKANAEKLPFKDNFFDKYIISFCLRNVTHINKALVEANRILKPGGIFYCLEFSTPESSLVNFIYSKYKNKIIPLIGKNIANNKSAYRYLEESIDFFPNQENLLELLNKNGFFETKYLNLYNGIVSIHIGYKI